MTRFRLSLCPAPPASASLLLAGLFFYLALCGPAALALAQPPGAGQPPAGAPAAPPSAATPTPDATPAAAPVDESAKSISINFDGVDLRAFIKYISQVTGKNFVIDDAVKGTITVLSPKPLSVPEVYKVFESVLEVNGYTALPTENFVKIVPAKTSRARSMPLIEGRQTVQSPNDSMVTQIVPLKNIRSPELRKVLAPLVSP
ncbi:MAG: type II secretion system protein GspD, partial [Acidobacteriota bacterium]